MHEEYLKHEKLMHEEYLKHEEMVINSLKQVKHEIQGKVNQIEFTSVVKLEIGL
jgi:hypothetical protein